MALGVVEGMQFTAQEKLLPDGGLLFLYTDGLTEATDENEGLFGRERVEQSLQNALDEGLTDGAAYIHRMTDDVAAFVKNASQSDDLTMLALRLSLKHYELENTEITLDCTKLEYIASSGLRLFILLLRYASQHGCSVCVKGANPLLMSIFEATGFKALFRFVD